MDAAGIWSYAVAAWAIPEIVSIGSWPIPGMSMLQDARDVA
jgi:hypothetical protein